ncbi:MAG TPA: helix-turn-helix domain-containing protein [Nakamurella sp.]|nr:helix-turn-helix domain-containing protein [Nakamurella sp.]
MPSEEPVVFLDRERYGLPARRSGAHVRAVIRASWARCQHWGLPIEDLDVPFTSDYDIDSRLTRSAGPVLSALQSTLADEPISMMLSDETGLVVSRSCNDTRIVKSLDKVALAPGSNYSETAVGTNGFGLALAANRPGLVAGDEHYNARLAGYTCAGAPIHDPVTGDVMGALSLTTWSERRNDLLLALAVQTAMNIEAQLAGRSVARSVYELDGYLQAIAQRPRIPVPSTARFRLSRFEVIERDAIVAALERSAGGVTEAAEDLGFSRATMYRKIKRYGIRTERAKSF